MKCSGSKGLFQELLEAPEADFECRLGQVCANFLWLDRGDLKGLLNPHSETVFLRFYYAIGGGFVSFICVFAMFG